MSKSTIYMPSFCMNFLVFFKESLNFGKVGKEGQAQSMLIYVHTKHDSTGKNIQTQLLKIEINPTTCFNQV